MFESIFPALATDGYRSTSAASQKYNCIAWGASIDSKWFWPDDDERSSWPLDVLKIESLEAVVGFYMRFGFDVCANGDFEPGFAKVAIYAKNSAPTHAARQLPSGWWTSKLGELEDIEHTLRGLEGDIYSRATIFLKRPVKSV